MSETAYPLQWPFGWRRTDIPQRSRFGTYWEKPSVAKARMALAQELGRLGARNPVLSTNMELRLDGQPRSDRREPADAGAAVYFTLAERRMVLACDRWLTVGDNVWSIAKTIEAQRGIERWGAVTAEQAFAGYAALEEKTQASCWEVLGLEPFSPEAAILSQWRAKLYAAHPDMGGSTEAMIALNAAKNTALGMLKGRSGG